MNVYSNWHSCDDSTNIRLRLVNNNSNDFLKVHLLYSYYCLSQRSNAVAEIKKEIILNLKNVI